MMFVDVANTFGTAAFEPTVIPTPSRTHYYKGVRLERKPAVRLPRAPKPLSQTVRNFLLTYDK